MPRRAWKPIIKRDDAAALAGWLDAGGDIEDYDPSLSGTPLLFAVYHGKLECVRLLAERGANLDRALNIATAMKNKEVVRYLLTRKPSRKAVAEALDIQRTEHVDEPDTEVEGELKRAKKKAAPAKKKKRSGK
jgi:hypothetical protein